MNPTTAPSPAHDAGPTPRRRRWTTRMSSSLGAFGMTAALGLAGAGTLAPMMCSPAAAPAPSTQQQVVDLANQQRAAAGLPALTVNGSLTYAAQAHANDQAARGWMSHVGSDGSDAGTRMVRSGYNVRNWGENVAVGYTSPSDVVSAWMASPGHRANILSGAYREIGVAVSHSTNGTAYWTMTLGSSW